MPNDVLTQKSITKIMLLSILNLKILVFLFSRVLFLALVRTRACLKRVKTWLLCLPDQLFLNLHVYGVGC